MKIKSLAPWFGGKRNMAPRIVEELGPHKAYWEPFCGSMAVLLNKPVSAMETVNDLHDDLINLARVLQREDTATALYAMVSRFLIHEDMLRNAKSHIDEYQSHCHHGDDHPPNVERAAWYMYLSWIGRNGLSGTNDMHGGISVRFSCSGGSATRRWLSSVESIPVWHERLQHVLILRRDGFAVIDRIADKPGTVIYCDPPYITKGAKYVHDFDADHHERLATLLQRFKQTRVIVSYYEHETVRRLYDRWRFEPVKATKALANQGMRDGTGAVAAPELLICNF